MKNLLLAASIALVAASCNKTEPKTSGNPPQQHHETETKNEMVALMANMMDEMHRATPTGNTDADFSKMMIEHHKGAMEMSELLLEQGKDKELRTFAKKVIDAQNAEIGLMKKFADRKETSADHKAFQQDLNRSMSAMMDKNIPVHNDIDRDYAQQMIPHHQSAVDMAKVYLEYGKEQELLKLCSAIVKTQTAEIESLKDWLARNENL
ncbi:DUF305 domain-containing protein [Chryseobacterium sp.]|uniref:DUF305 domain-containing protein n=1 Tax=Chryseobacterium sp. TaxID=1871047 RepID=UPI0011CC3B18|nr:DUF305 domain-containing protein [Chryseobacterium sp.]TXF79584.1 DUF305 domain-containing protein [Chryseobacterium sp.]